MEDSFATTDIPSVVALAILLSSLCYLLYSLVALCRETLGGGASSSAGETKEYHSVRQMEDGDAEEEDEDTAIEMTYAS